MDGFEIEQYGLEELAFSIVVLQHAPTFYSCCNSLVERTLGAQAPNLTDGTPAIKMLSPSLE